MKHLMKLARSIPGFLTATLFLHSLTCLAAGQSSAPETKPSDSAQQAPATKTESPSAQRPAQQQAPPDSSSDMQPIPPSDSEKPDSATESAKPANSQPSAPKSSTPPSLKSENTDDEAITIKRRVDEVNVVFTVTDRHGRYVRDLQRNDFKVIDDKKPATAI